MDRLSLVSAEVGPLERIEVPAGSFAAYRVVYRVEKEKATEKYTVFVSRDLPRVLLREEFPNGSIDELIEVRGNADGSQASEPKRSFHLATFESVGHSYHSSVCVPNENSPARDALSKESVRRFW